MATGEMATGEMATGEMATGEMATGEMATGEITTDDDTSRATGTVMLSGNDLTVGDRVSTAAANMTAEETTKWIGGRLRSIRQQKQLSMLDVDELSNGEFGPSTIGAYERGDRTISLTRLDRLARFYGVTIDQFLPRSADESWTATRSSPIEERLTLNLVELRSQTEEMYAAMARYVELIRQQRQDSHPRIITLRGTDALVFAAMLAVPVDMVIPKLASRSLLYRGAPESA